MIWGYPLLLPAPTRPLWRLLIWGNLETFKERKLLPTSQSPTNCHGSSTKGQENGTRSVPKSTRQRVLQNCWFLLDFYHWRQCGRWKQRPSETKAEAIVTQPQQKGWRQKPPPNRLATNWANPIPSGATASFHLTSLSNVVKNSGSREEMIFA